MEKIQAHELALQEKRKTLEQRRYSIWILVKLM